MIGIDFPEANLTMNKPSDMTDEQCGALRVWRGISTIEETGDQVPTLISKWQLSKEDLEEIQKTGCIWLSIVGRGMPPVSLFTENPFINGT
jgi:hypothetical protein